MSHPYICLVDGQYFETASASEAPYRVPMFIGADLLPPVPEGTCKSIGRFEIFQMRIQVHISHTSRRHALGLYHTITRVIRRTFSAPKLSLQWSHVSPAAMM